MTQILIMNYRLATSLARNEVRKVRNVILDWSGTTADAHVLAPAVVFKEVFDRFDVPITMKEAREPMGLRKDLHIAQILKNPVVQKRWKETYGRKSDDDDVKQMFDVFVPAQLDVLPEYTTLLPGVADVVDTLRTKHDIKFGSTTGFTKDMVDVLLEDAAKQGYSPDTSVAGDEVPNGMGVRPYPYMLLQNLAMQGMKNVKDEIKGVIKVDDTVSGVGEGVNAGCWAVGVYKWSNYTDVDSLEEWANMSDDEKLARQEASRQVLLNSGAHYVIPDLNDLEAVVDDINVRMANGECP